MDSNFTCTRCKLRKEAGDFPRNARMKSGLDPYCRACRSETNRAYYAKNKAAFAARQREWRRQNPEKYEARLAARRISEAEWIERKAATAIRTKEKRRAWRFENPERAKANYERAKERHRERMSDPEYRERYLARRREVAARHRAAAKFS